MAIVGFSFSKIHVERKGQMSPKVDINNNVTIKDVEETELSVGTRKEKGIRFLFEFTSVYSPDVADILIEGDLLYVDTKLHDEILKGWKKNKKLPPEVTTPILNAVLTRSNIEALVLSRDVNLPPPIRLPKVRSKE